MTQPTGVFVRLPLSDEQRELMVDAAALGQHDDSHDKALLAIGTPVTGGELEVYHALTVMTTGGPERVPLVRQLDAQAALASAQAEIVRLREHLTSCTVNLENVMTKMGDWCWENGPPEYLGPEEVMSAMDAYETGKEALKGPAS